MAYIPLNNDYPGIRGLVNFRPETGQPLYALAQVILRGESPLPEADRELIAAFVSRKNQCVFCCESHAAAARYLYHSEGQKVDVVLDDYLQAPITEKLKTLLTIAERVTADARTVGEKEISDARREGATDREIHDAVLIAATFCMFNRYVDGLGADTPTDQTLYAEMGARLGEHGYTFNRKS